MVGVKAYSMFVSWAMTAMVFLGGGEEKLDLGESEFVGIYVPVRRKRYLGWKVWGCAGWELLVFRYVHFP